MFARWWGGKKSQSESEEVDEFQSRFITFDEGYCIIAEYIKDCPRRNYGDFDEGM